MIFVTVIEPRNRKIYVNGVYDDPLGPTPTLVTLNAGSHIFETLTSGSTARRLYRQRLQRAGTGQRDDRFTPVVPPKPKGS